MPMMRFILAAVLTALLAAGASNATVVRTGLYGTVMRGPITPVCVAEQPCDEPAAGAVLVFSRNGSDVARVKVRADGSYRIALRPGLYTVRTARRIDPTTARVRLRRMTRVDFSIDTGIR
jgi:hypothetical protein